MLIAEKYVDCLIRLKNINIWINIAKMGNIRMGESSVVLLGNFEPYPICDELSVETSLFKAELSPQRFPLLPSCLQSG